MSLDLPYGTLDALLLFLSLATPLLLLRWTSSRVAERPFASRHASRLAGRLEGGVVARPTWPWPGRELRVAGRLEGRGVEVVLWPGGASSCEVVLGPNPARLEPDLSRVREGQRALAELREDLRFSVHEDRVVVSWSATALERERWACNDVDIDAELATLRAVVAFARAVEATRGPDGARLSGLLDLPPASRLRLVEVPLAGQRCPWCHDALAPSLAKGCPTCATPHHAECLVDAGCAATGCARGRAARPRARA